MNIIKLNLDQLKIDSYNPRKDLKPGDSEYIKIKNSLETFGLVQPFVINQNYELISGHQRFSICKELNYKTVDCVLLEIDKMKEKALNIALNKISGLWDLDKLSDLIDELQQSEFDFDFGFDDFEVESLQKELENQNITIENKQPKNEEKADNSLNKQESSQFDNKLDDIVIDTISYGIKENEIWRLGTHYLLCGDSSNINLINSFFGQTLEQGEQITLYHIDPPYGMRKDGITNDNLKDEDLIGLVEKCFNAVYPFIKKNGSFYCWGNDTLTMDVYSNICKPLIKDNKMTFRNLVTWSKGHGRGQNSEIHRMYATADEKLLYTVFGVFGFNNNADFFCEAFEPIRLLLDTERLKMNWTIKDVKKICGLSENSGDHWFGRSQWEMIPEKYFKVLSKEAKGKAFTQDVYNQYLKAKNEYADQIPYFNNTHDNFNNVWQYHVENSLKEKKEAQNFPSPKPQFLMDRIIKTSSKENDIVFDSFGGSGSTLISCENLNRRALLVEIDPSNCSIILNRYHKLFPDKEIERVSLIAKKE